MPELTDYLTNYFYLPQESLQNVANLFEHTTLKKGDFFVKKGHYCNQLAFVNTGTLRVFDQYKNKEITQWIATQGYFLTDLRSLIFQQPARFYMQALTDCSFHRITIENYQKIGNLVPQWHELEKRFISACFITLEERVFEFISATAEERYQRYFSQNSTLFNEVPLQYLASVMGMTPETLSRLRAKNDKK